MACLLVPAAGAAITTIATEVMKTKEKEPQIEKVTLAENTEAGVQKIPFTRKLKWLSNLLWGGSALLAFEHVWHGEIVPWFPFLTAAADPADALEMLHEMSTVGVGMAAAVTLAWLGMVAVSSVFEKREEMLKPEKKQEV